MIIDLSMSSVSLGATFTGDGYTTAVEFITWLKTQGHYPYVGFESTVSFTDPKEIVDRFWENDLSKYGAEHLIAFNLHPQWCTNKHVFIGGDIQFYPKSNQFSVRLNIHPPDVVKSRDVYDELAEQFASFSTEIHEQINSKMTVVDRNSIQTGMRSPYNLNTLPLFISWMSVFDKDVKQKHNLDTYQISNSEISLVENGNTIILKSNQSWHEYKRSHWSEESKSLFKTIHAQPLKRS